MLQVRDIMQSDVTTISPEATVADAARTMADRRLSGLPVVDGAGALIGVVSEGDLLHRAELGVSAPRSWWLGLFEGANSANEYVKAHGRTVGEVMTRDVETIRSGASIAAAASKMERSGVKRLPVVDADGAMVGIVSRADLVRALASAAPAPVEAPAADGEVRAAVLNALADSPAGIAVQTTVIVRDGVVELWGLAPDDAMADAARIAAESAPGVKKVESHIGRFPSAYYG